MNHNAEYRSQKNLTLILYILYIIAIFTAGILAVIALIVNYAKRSDVQGTIFASHFRWQMHTFWWYLIWNILAFVPFIFLMLIDESSNSFASIALAATVFCIGAIGLSWVWVVYRAIRGLIALNDNKPMYDIE